MKINLYEAPTTEPVSLSELLLHLRHESDDIATALTTTQSIRPGLKDIADNFTTHVGAGVEVLGKVALVNLNAGTVGAGGKVDVKIQESNDNATWADWNSYTQITAANDDAIHEKHYTGGKRYVRVVAKVTVAACPFGVDVITIDESSVEDDLLNELIQLAREHVEDYTRRAILTQTWDLYLDRWPDGREIVLPYGNLQSVTSVKYKDSAGAETTLTATTDYLVETNGADCGQIVLPPNVSWPSGTLYPSNPINIRYVCGWEDVSDVPARIKGAVKRLCADMYANRGEAVIGASVQPDTLAYRLLSPLRLWEGI